MQTWWAAFERPSPSRPAIRRLIEEVAPGTAVSDLGGCLSLNLWLQSADLVLRVHQPFVSRARVLALRDLRRRLAEEGLLVAEPREIRGRTIRQCEGGWAEVETYIPHQGLAPTWESYIWMFRGIGRLHRALSQQGIKVPRPAVSTFAPPGSLRRWLGVTEQAVKDDTAARSIIGQTRRLLGPLTAEWVPASMLPTQLIHGDGKLSNIRRAPSGATAYLDFGFSATRPRIHDLAHSLAWMVLRPDDTGTAEAFPWWDKVPELLSEYEDTAKATLTDSERRALPPYMAAVAMYEPAIAGYARDPIGNLRDPALARFLSIGEWILANPHAPLGAA
jgi:Ser/Thr protein kinase RdoA (MazF antagonist)